MTKIDYKCIRWNILMSEIVSTEQKDNFCVLVWELGSYTEI